MSKFYFVNIVDCIDPSGEPAGPVSTRDGAVELARDMHRDGSFSIDDDLPVIIEIRDNGVPILETITRSEIDPIRSDV